jgi:hypothetical protein
MGNLARNVAWGVLGGTTTRVARSATRRALHTDHGTPRLPDTARRRRGLGSVLFWAAATGAVLAIADLLREQGRDTTRFS